MHLINLFQRSQITSLVLAILFTSHSALAATTPAPTPTCDEYFYLSGKPGEAMCRSNHVTYTCPLDKCKVDNKDWASATFTKCDLLDKPRGNVIPGRQKESIVPMQYHVQNTGVEVQNQGDRFWYRCVSTVTDRSNDHRASESLSASNGASHHLLMHLFKFISVYSMSKSIKL
ncbi:hypothetical protein PSTT_09130 [Puccinia striiformis]|uniref:Chitin-binding type-2 domain-containing protein n=1 Tax=Puccinia striiformis TaxID=27350 RepID=A0A2S4VA04_9BASI|nr:hypothetical protein PSTT_09130 [Puccinia striiformis]